MQANLARFFYPVYISEKWTAAAVRVGPGLVRRDSAMGAGSPASAVRMGGVVLRPFDASPSAASSQSASGALSGSGSPGLGVHPSADAEDDDDALVARLQSRQ